MRVHKDGGCPWLAPQHLWPRGEGGRQGSQVSGTLLTRVTVHPDLIASTNHHPLMPQRSQVGLSSGWGPGNSRAPHPLTPSLQAACGATSGPVPPTAPTCPRSATPRTGTCWWTGATSTTCQVSEPTGLAGPLSVSESVCACLCLCIPLGRLPMAIRACQHDALGLPAPAVRPQGRAPPHGRRLHQQPARQVAARSLMCTHMHTGK